MRGEAFTLKKISLTALTILMLMVTLTYTAYAQTPQDTLNQLV